MIKVCHVTSVHSKKDDRIFYRECLSLVKAGYEVHEIASNVEDEISDGVYIKGVVVPKNKWLRVLFGRKNVYKKCCEVNADVYHFHDPELIPLGIKLKNKKKKLIIFDSHEDVPAQILTKSWIPKFLRRSISKFYAKYESKKLKKYDALVSVTPSIVDRLLNINKKTFQLTNYPIYIKNKLEVSKKYERAICFAGTISSQRMHHKILQAIDDIQNVRYRLAGGCSKSYLNYLKSFSAWDKVEYVGKIPFVDVFRFISESSIGIVINDYYPNVGYKLGTLGIVKLFEFMQAGLPVICTDFILWKQIIDKWQCGICVNPHSIEEIRDAIIYLLNNKNIAKQMGDNGRRAFKEEYNWKAQEPILFSMYKEIEGK